MDTLASVIIPTYNRRAYLRLAVQSALVHPQMEVIVVDDGSTDDSLETIEDLPIRRLRFPSNRGIAHARNAGIQAARGKYLFFLDSDDCLVPSSVLPRIAWLEARPGERGLIGFPAGILDANGQGTKAPIRGDLPLRLSLDLLREGQRFSSAPGLWCFRRGALGRGFDPGVRIVCDTELMLRLLAKGPLALWPKPVVWVRHHTQNISGGDRHLRVPPKVLAESYLLQTQYGIPLKP